MAVEIKERTSIDPVALQRLYEHAPWAQGRKPDDIQRMLEKTDFHFSAWDSAGGGQRLVGFARVLTDHVYRATLWDVVVHPDYQGRGVGDALMEQILSHPVLSKVEKFWLNTQDRSSFYEKFGFVRSNQGMVRIQPQKNESS